MRPIPLSVLMAIISVVVGLAFEVSGIQSKPLAAVLWSLTAILSLIAAYQHVPKFRAKLPVSVLKKLLYICLGSLLMLAAFVYMQWANAMPYDRIVFAIVFFSSAGVLYLLSGLAPQSIVIESGDSDAEHAKVVEKLGDQIKELESNLFEVTKQLTDKESEFSAFKNQHKRLLVIAERDNRDISKYVAIIYRSVDYTGLDDGLSPHIEIIFHIINASVYKITIDKNIEDGAVYLNNVELNPKMTQIEGSLHNISREDTEKRFLVIKQRLTPAEVERIRNPLPDDAFKLSMLHLTVKGGDGYPGVNAQRLSLPSMVPIKPHQSVVNKLKNRMSELEREKSALESRWNAHVFQYSWLFAKVETQGKDISSYVELENASWCYDNFTPMRRSVFGLDIFNKSIFDITIDDVIGGYIKFEGIELRGQKLIINSPIKVSSGSRGKITIEQRLHAEEADLIESKNAQDAEFDLAHLVITIKGEHFSGSQHIKIGRCGVVRRPKQSTWT